MQKKENLDDLISKEERNFCKAILTPTAPGGVDFYKKQKKETT
jgi:hypothetical protein